MWIRFISLKKLPNGRRNLHVMFVLSNPQCWVHRLPCFLQPTTLAPWKKVVHTFSHKHVMYACTPRRAWCSGGVR